MGGGIIMALVWAFSGDLTGHRTPLLTSGWTLYHLYADTAHNYGDIYATARHPLVGYGGASYALRVYCSPGSPFRAAIETPNTAFTALADGVVGFHWWRNDDDDGYGTGGFFIKSGGVEVVRLKVSSAGVVSVYVYETATSALVLQFTCTPLWTISTTKYFGVRYKAGASGEIEVSIDGGAADTATGAYHTGAWDTLRWDLYGYGGTRYIWMPTVWSSAADPALTIPQWVAKITPDADAAAGSFTASTGTDLFAMVDEAAYSATDYIETTTTPDDTMRLTGTSATSVNAAWAPAAIAGVVGYAAVRGDGALNAAQIAWSSGGTGALGSTVATSTSVVTVTDVLTVDPNTSAAFANVAAIDALQFGVKAS
jgi:hypothetical protein